MDWQPIETAPHGTEVLVCERIGRFCSMAVARWADINAADSEYGTVAHQPLFLWLISDHKNDPIHLRGLAPTHWMLLPLPPQGA